MNLVRFIENCIKNNGGTIQPLWDVEANSGYMVGIGYEKQVQIDPDKALFAQLKLAAQNFIAVYADILDTNPDYFFGVWINDGILYLDVSQNVEDLREAVEIGLGNNELSIYDLNKGKVIDLTIDKGGKQLRYSPQTAGTETQKAAYKTQWIDQFIQQNK